MTATKRLVVDLPEEQVAMIEARVAAGEYESVSALVSARLEEDGAPFVGMIDEGSAEWRDFAGRVQDTVRRLDAGEERTYSAEDVRADLAARRRDRTLTGSR